MKPIKCPVPITHELEAWAFSRAARSLAAHYAKTYGPGSPLLYLRGQAAKYAAMAAKEQERLGAIHGPRDA